MSDDNQDVASQTSLLYARANVLIRKFSKYSREALKVHFYLQMHVHNFGSIRLKDWGSVEVLWC